MTQKRRRNLKLDYNRKKYSNPFFQNKKPHSRKPSTNSHWQLKLSIFIFLLVIVLITWTIFFSKLFIIKSIELTTPSNIPHDEVMNFIWQQTDQKKFLIASQKNIFIFDKLAISTNLKSRYAIGEITINNKLPGTLKINIKGKAVILIWHEAGKYYYVFDDNSAIETDPLQIKSNNLTVINNAGLSKIVNNQLQETPDKLTYSINLFTKLKNNPHQLSIEGLVNQDNQDNTVNVKILNGPLLLFSTKEDLDMQINKLYAIINNRLMDDFMKKDHIDLRFGDNVYLK